MAKSVIAKRQVVELSTQKSLAARRLQISIHSVFAFTTLAALGFAGLYHSIQLGLPALGAFSFSFLCWLFASTAFSFSENMMLSSERRSVYLLSTMLAMVSSTLAVLASFSMIALLTLVLTQWQYKI